MNNESTPPPYEFMKGLTWAILWQFNSDRSLKASMTWQEVMACLLILVGVLARKGGCPPWLEQLTRIVEEAGNEDKLFHVPILREAMQEAISDRNRVCWLAQDATFQWRQGAGQGLAHVPEEFRDLLSKKLPHLTKLDEYDLIYLAANLWRSGMGETA